MMEKKPNEQSEASNSEESRSGKSEEYERFENAAKVIFRHAPDQAGKIRKSPASKARGKKRSS